MRIFVLALMIILLPLRGWMGEAMATEMAAHSAATAVVAATSAASADREDSNSQNSVATASGSSKYSAARLFSSMSSPHNGKPPSALSASHPGCEAYADTYAESSAADGDSEGEPELDASNGDGCRKCPACDTCNSAAMSRETAELGPDFERTASPASIASVFANADAALSQKPPIS